MISRLALFAFVLLFLPATASGEPPEYEMGNFQLVFLVGADPVEPVPEAERATFDGIVRADGRVATRNFVGILSTVNCSATVVRKIAEWFTPERLADCMEEIIRG